MIDIFNQIFGMDFTPDKEQLKRDYILEYINGRITKKQLDDKMEELNMG